MSLTKEEIVSFTDTNLEDYDLFNFGDKENAVISAWESFLVVHELNPRKEHEFVLTLAGEEYHFRWTPEVVLGINTSKYEVVYIGIGARQQEGSGNIRLRGFVPSF